MTVKIILWSK